MVPDVGRIQEGLLHLNEMTGPVFKIKLNPNWPYCVRMAMRSVARWFAPPRREEQAELRLD
jgi:hypothetical protein